MKKLNLLLSSILLGSITSSYATQLPFPPILYDGPFLTPRFIATGLAGADPLARGDFLFPFWHGPCSLTFGDIQGEYGEFGAWYAGGGVGFRRIYDPTKIWGAYLFYDVNHSKHDNTFGVSVLVLKSFLNNGMLVSTAIFLLALKPRKTDRL